VPVYLGTVFKQASTTLGIGTKKPIPGRYTDMTPSKEEVIHMMCLEYRHDFGLRKEDDSNPLQSGMTERDAKVLYSVMEFIYNKIIELAEAKTFKGKQNATKRRKRKS
jgi:hypothetical protein